MWFLAVPQYKFPSCRLPNLALQKCLWNTHLMYTLHRYGLCLSEWIPSFLCCRLLASAAISGFGWDSILWGLLWNRLDIDL